MLAVRRLNASFYQRNATPGFFHPADLEPAVGSNALHPVRWQDTQIIIDKR
jgi:hypothetical protein